MSERKTKEYNEKGIDPENNVPTVPNGVAGGGTVVDGLGGWMEEAV